MRLLIVRHGDPDYDHDSLTEKGFREAELLSEKLKKEKLHCSSRSEKTEAGCSFLLSEIAGEKPTCLKLPGA